MDNTRSTHMNLHEIMCSYETINYEKLKQPFKEQFLMHRD
jgi:hypothetical protein